MLLASNKPHDLGPLLSTSPSPNITMKKSLVTGPEFLSYLISYDPG